MGPHKRIPGAEDWREYRSDRHLRRAREIFFGKSIDDVRDSFGPQAIELAQALRHMPRNAFGYYVLAFAAYLLSEAARGNADAASTFLGLLVDREVLDPGSVVEVYEDLSEALEFVGSHQEHFGAEPAIYGSFRDRADTLVGICAGKARS
jgi:hypothetical protein